MKQNITRNTRKFTSYSTLDEATRMNKLLATTNYSISIVTGIRAKGKCIAYTCWITPFCVCTHL
jgi:hypothetical protein